MRSIFIVALALVTVVGTAIDAQERVTEQSAWQAVVATLPPGAFVALRLKDGRHFRGTILQQGPDTLLFKPKTRVPVPAAEIAFRDIDSVELRKPGMSLGKKVVLGVAIGFGALMLLGAIVVHIAGEL
jgi:hypothetical protein